MSTTATATRPQQILDPIPRFPGTANPPKIHPVGTIPSFVRIRGTAITASGRSLWRSNAAVNTSIGTPKKHKRDPLYDKRDPYKKPISLGIRKDWE